VYVAGALLLAAFLLIYLPGIGHGFIKDDFAWVAGSRVTTVHDVLGLFQHNVGFYRPLVSASFAADYGLWRLDAFGYGLTNLVVFFIDAVLLFHLAKRLTLSREAALVAVAAWAFNFHGVNMALLWISGRTELLLCLFALGAALAALRGRHVLAGLLALLAMLCKEEAVMLPVLFVLLDWRAVRRTVPMWLALAIYLALRLHSGAFGPTDAPSYYQLSLAPLTVLRNALEYLDRGATFGAAIALAILIAIGTSRVAFTTAEKAVVRFGAAWFVSFYAITVLLPVRSSLYAFTPSVGSALAVAALASAAQRISQKRFERCCAALIALSLVVIPIYRQRNERWVVPADLSASVVRTLQLATAGSAGGDIALIDDPSARFGLDSSFGGLFGDAVHLMIGSAWNGMIVPATSGAVTNPVNRPRLVFALRNGRLEPAIN
jgi:hypothetical protein